MTPLPSELRSGLDNAITEARDVAEAAAEAALTMLAVAERAPFATMDEAQRRLRRALRARSRQLGGGDLETGLPLLVEEIAYEQWHRMLFARFLAENSLLMHPEGVSVTLEDCADLALEERAEDAWDLAARYASDMLPGIFRTDDPAVQIRFAPEGRHQLERIVTEQPALVFTSDDGLGWVYQFWQSKKKDEVNRSERKIGGADIAPVTQLFTENYMVRFLLENSLGAWWTARHPDSPLVKTFVYLRFREDGTPAAGAFPGWPDRAAEITIMDPCCGSGHFLAVAFLMLWRMRMEEEGLGEAETADAVIRDNLFGLELDPRCTQIAAFALTLEAWKVGGYREIPLPNVACSGIAVEGQLDAWIELASGDYALEQALKWIYGLFRQAPDLGSLINPIDIPLQERMFASEYTRVEPLLEKALKREQGREDPVASLLGGTALGVLRAARLLAREYTLVATNVPYRARGKQAETLQDFCESYYPDSKNDLAMVFMERCAAFCHPGGTFAIVTPQNWQYLGTYTELRKRVLTTREWNFIANLGTRSFQTPMYDFNVSLSICSSSYPSTSTGVPAVDASAPKTVEGKARLLSLGEIQRIEQMEQLENPDARIVVGSLGEGALLGKYAESYQGLKTGDDLRFRRLVWEMPYPQEGWRLYQTTVSDQMPFGGRHLLIDWRHDGQNLARRQGVSAWGKWGVAVNQMGELPATLYSGDIFDSNITAIVPRQKAHLAALWLFCQSSNFKRSVRQIDKAMKVTNSSFVKVPFDLEFWQSVADEELPDGLPKPHSRDLTQWLFAGHPTESFEPLQVAVARLLGYHWPQQKPDSLNAHADADGVVCLPPVAGEPPAAERLRSLLAVAYGYEWSQAVQDRLLAEAGYAGKGLDVWLPDGFFEQHCRVFQNRPFIWHIWDGRMDGFSALVNYHKLDTALLDRLIYTYLGDWIRVQRGDRDAGVAGADGRLVAALELQKKLEAIQEGEPPYDIYVRWKPLHQQPIGWDPDLNDGVRLNIRPFVTAEVLRRRFNVHWRKDRGKNPDGSERHNDLHFTRAEKQQARREAGPSGARKAR